MPHSNVLNIFFFFFEYKSLASLSIIQAYLSPQRFKFEESFINSTQNQKHYSMHEPQIVFDSSPQS